MYVSARWWHRACVVVMRRSRRVSGVGEPDDPRGDEDGGVGEPSSPSPPRVRFDVVAIDSFERFYRVEYGPLLGLGYQLTGRRDVAEDLVQDAMLRAYREWGRISSYERPDLWLRRAMLNLATSRWRRQRTVARSWFRFDRQPDVQDPSVETIDVWRQVRELPRRQAQVVVLYYGCDLSVDQVAEIIDCAPGTVRTHLTRARAALAQVLEQPGGAS